MKKIVLLVALVVLVAAFLAVVALPDGATLAYGTLDYFGPHGNYERVPAIPFDSWLPFLPGA